MKILFVTDLCPINENEKGLPLTLLSFIEDFIKLGHQVTLFRPNVIPNVILRGRKILPEDEFEWKGIKIINKNFLTPFFRKKQFKFLEKQGFDVILSHMPSGVLAANKISKLLNIPYFASVHSSDIQVLENWKYFYMRKLMKRAYNEACGVMPRSYWLLEKIKKHIKNKNQNFGIVPSGIEKEKIIEKNILENKIKNYYGKPYKIFSVGNFIKRKNFHLLIKAISKIDEKIILEIAGDGKNRKSLEKLAFKLGVQEKVKFLGKIPNDEVLSSMASHNIFILPSLNETFGMVYLEALAKGCVVICSKNSGMAGFIKDGENGLLTGVLVDDIKNTIIKAINLENPERIINMALDTATKMERVEMAKKYLNAVQKFLV